MINKIIVSIAVLTSMLITNTSFAQFETTYTIGEWADPVKVEYVKEAYKSKVDCSDKTNIFNILGFNTWKYEDCAPKFDFSTIFNVENGTESCLTQDLKVETISDATYFSNKVSLDSNTVYLLNNDNYSNTNWGHIDITNKSCVAIVGKNTQSTFTNLGVTEVRPVYSYKAFFSLNNSSSIYIKNVNI